MSIPKSNNHVQDNKHNPNPHAHPTTGYFAAQVGEWGNTSEQDLRDDRMDTIALNRNEEAINKLTHKIIGCAMQVHSTLGNGFQEVIYQRALAIEFAFQGLNFNREMEMDLYRDQPIGTRRVDFYAGETFWLTQKRLAELFGVAVPAVSKHLKNIFETGELQEDSVISKMETTAPELGTV